ncbi:MAG: beta-lactamase family protein [Acidimicrobiales bacterium]|nr:beta-lactamase family protein [Acidimicrobiales bacterium]
MTTAGFDSQRLASVSALVDRYVAEGKLAGAQVQVAHRGEVALRHTVGRADVASDRPLGDDAIYRIYSMTKPITSIALMQLYEQGRVLLEDPVSAYIPEFAEMQVFTGGTPTAPKVRPAQTVMTVKDVLTHASGLTYGFFFQNNLDAMYREDGLGDFQLPDYTLEEGMRRLATKPLAFDPGTAWNYSMSTDVCGRLVEVISGMGLNEYFAEHITGPLGMADTAFHVPADKKHRFTSNYALTPDEPLLIVDSFDASPYLSPPVFLSGGGGLVGTVDDYQRFVDMLLNGGELDGRRIIGRKTLEYMTINHLPEGKTLNELGQSLFSEAVMEGMGFGLGFSTLVDPARNGAVSSGGEFAWGGAASTAFWVDPAEEITCVFMTQLMPSSSYPLRRELKATVYQALR